MAEHDFTDVLKFCNSAGLVYTVEWEDSTDDGMRAKCFVKAWIGDGVPVEIMGETFEETADLPVRVLATVEAAWYDYVQTEDPPDEGPWTEEDEFLHLMDGLL